MEKKVIVKVKKTNSGVELSNDRGANMQPAPLFDKNIYNEAVAKFGITAQKFMCIEECAELIDVLAKQNRGRRGKFDIIEELADVYIMVCQMAHFYGFQDFNDKVAEKLQRLQILIKIHQ